MGRFQSPLIRFKMVKASSCRKPVIRRRRQPAESCASVQDFSLRFSGTQSGRSAQRIAERTSPYIRSSCDRLRLLVFSVVE
jgi:hypothetical protein